MATTPAGKLQFTQAQYHAARQRSALEYAMQRGYDLMAVGSRFYLREHNSMVFLPNGRWFWNSRGVCGGALEFVQIYEGRTLPEAVLALTDGSCAAISAAISQPPHPPAPAFHLPERGDADRLIEYLCHQRGCDIELVQACIKNELIFLGINVCGTVQYPNAVFVSRDQYGKPRAAMLRGVSYGSTYKGAVAGSDKSWPFELPAASSASVLAVFESPIDAISHASLAKYQRHPWAITARIALGGNPPPNVVAQYLKCHPQIQSVEICFDADQAGRTLEERLRRELRPVNGVKIRSTPPSSGKDWNDYLLIYEVAHHIREKI